jgi:hypothetical protein
MTAFSVGRRLTGWFLRGLFVRIRKEYSALLVCFYLWQGRITCVIAPPQLDQSLQWRSAAALYSMQCAPTCRCRIVFRHNFSQLNLVQLCVVPALVPYGCCHRLAAAVALALSQGCVLITRDCCWGCYESAHGVWLGCGSLLSESVLLLCKTNSQQNALSAQDAWVCGLCRLLMRGAGVSAFLPLFWWPVIEGMGASLVHEWHCACVSLTGPCSWHSCIWVVCVWVYTRSEIQDSDCRLTTPQVGECCSEHCSSAV